MSAAKHTPGPWKVLEHSWCETSIVAEGFDHGICGLDINHATEESQAADEALMAANARLIAAAPDLLVALEAEQEWKAREADGAIDPEWDYERMVGDKRRAAIAKAIGSAS